jgi:hypothetical protein
LYFCGFKQEEMYDKDFLFGKDTIEFVTVSLEFCSFMERVGETDAKELVDKCSKLLPLLYLKAILIPVVSEEEYWDLEESVTEEGYNALHDKLAIILGKHDVYLSAEMHEMKYSDTPVAASIGEDLADMYQDLANFLFVYREGVEEYMGDALSKCRYAFDTYWGARLLSCLGAMHPLREVYGLASQDSLDMEPEEDFYGD